MPLQVFPERHFFVFPPCFNALRRSGPIGRKQLPFCFPNRRRGRTVIASEPSRFSFRVTAGDHLRRHLFRRKPPKHLLGVNEIRARQSKHHFHRPIPQIRIRQTASEIVTRANSKGTHIADLNEALLAVIEDRHIEIRVIECHEARLG